MSLLSRSIQPMQASNTQLWQLIHHYLLHSSQSATSNVTQRNCADNQPDFIVSDEPFMICLVFATSPYAVWSLHLPQKLSLNAVDLMHLGVATAVSLLGSGEMNHKHNLIVQRVLWKIKSFLNLTKNGHARLGWLINNKRHSSALQSSKHKNASTINNIKVKINWILQFKSNESIG